MATLLMRAPEGAGADKKQRRARKSKNVQKKQPQRGLGVAQLEKLRLQEQSLHCSSSSYAMRLCPSSDHPLARCDGDVSQSFLSLASDAQSPTVRESVVPPLTHGEHSCTQGLLMQDKGYDNVDVKRVASRALACLSSSTKFSPNSSYFSTVFSNQLLIDGQPQALKDEERSPVIGDSSKANLYTSPAIHNFKRSGSFTSDGNYKLRQVLKEVGGIPLTFTDPRYFETVLGVTGTSDVTHLHRKRLEFLVGIPSSADRTTKELSSFQSFSSSHGWPPSEQASGRKRPWPLSQDDTESLDLNAPAGEHDGGSNERHSSNLHEAPGKRMGAHYTTGIVRNALGNSCHPFGKIKTGPSVSLWQESDSPAVNGYQTDLGKLTDSGLRLKQHISHCPVKDSGSSVSVASAFLALKSSHIALDDDVPPSSMKDRTSNSFLSLSISSCPTSNKNWLENEESTEESPVNFQMSKQSCTGYSRPATSSKTRKSYFQQEVISEVEGSKRYALDYGLGTRKALLFPEEPDAGTSLLHSRRFTSPSSSKTAGESRSYHSMKTPRTVGDECLDLTLAL